jgi:hypothetical protein
MPSHDIKGRVDIAKMYLGLIQGSYSYVFSLFSDNEKKG